MIAHTTNGTHIALGSLGTLHACAANNSLAALSAITPRTTSRPLGASPLPSLPALRTVVSGRSLEPTESLGASLADVPLRTDALEADVALHARRASHALRTVRSLGADNVVT